MDDIEVIKKRADAQRTFTPGSAINSTALFSGRSAQITSVLGAIMRPGLHAVMFGERGVGKTSLANVLHAFLPQEDRFYTIKVNAAANQSFTDIWKCIFRDMQLHMVSRKLIPTNEEVNAIISHLVDQDPPAEITPSDVRFVLSQMPQARVIIIVDEFDRITDEEAVTRFADTIKTLSDYSIDVTLILVAVGDSVDALVQAHPSLTRALVQVSLPRMSDEELGVILDRGMIRLGMRMDARVRSKIVDFSQGLPHYTHLLALEATVNALLDRRLDITLEDLQSAIEAALAKTEETTIRAYHKATSRGRLYPTVLLGCAHAKKDMRGYFSPADVGRALRTVTNGEISEEELSRFTRHLRDFSTEDKGAVLIEEGRKGQFRYRFADPMMPPFVILKGISGTKRD